MYLRPTSSFVLTSILVVLLAGCLPYTCRKTEPRALYPSDSLSQRIAADVVPDTLVPIRRSTGATDRTLEYPTSLVRSSDGDIVVSDARQHCLFVFDSAGNFRYLIEEESFSYPFLAGFRGDTLLALNRGSSTLDFIVDDRVVKSTPIPDGPGATAVATSGGIYYKTVGEENWFTEDVPGYIARLTSTGDTTEPRVTLPGPYWRHRGFMRAWGDTLISLSGYRPVVDLLLPGGRFDTLALEGFDSPMLARSRAFMEGSVDTAPVLTSSAVARDSGLFVLNLRPRRLQVDLYDRSGRLQKIYRESEPAAPEEPEIFPMDFTVYRSSSDQLRVAVAYSEPEPSLRVYEAR